MTATVAAAIAAGRALPPIGRRLVWHMWDAAKGAWAKIDGVDDVELPDEMVVALQAQQQQQLLPQQQQQQQQAQATPSNSKVKVHEKGELKIYSDSPKVTPNLFEHFDKAPDDTQDAAEPATCQFGPTTIITYPIASSIQEQQDIAQSKINSILDGKGTNGPGIDRLQDDDWGWKNGGDMAAKINAVILKRIEDEMVKLKQERDMYKQQVEKQTATINVIGQQLTTTNVIVSTPIQRTHSIKDIMAIIKNGGATNNATTHGGHTNSVMITDGHINRRDQIPNSDDSPGDRRNGGGIYQLGNGGGSNDGDGGDEPGSGGAIATNRFGGK